MIFTRVEVVTGELEEQLEKSVYEKLVGRCGRISRVARRQATVKSPFPFPCLTNHLGERYPKVLRGQIK